MIRKSSWIALAFAGVLVAVVPVAAHHAVAAQYDMDKAGEWTGTLKKMEFINPHSMLHLDVQSPDGKVTEWVFQTTNAGTLRTKGLARTGPGSLEVGAKYTGEGLPGAQRQSDGIPPRAGVPRRQRTDVLVRGSERELTPKEHLCFADLRMSA